MVQFEFSSFIYTSSPVIDPPTATFTFTTRALTEPPSSLSIFASPEQVKVPKCVAISASTLSIADFACVRPPMVTERAFILAPSATEPWTFSVLVSILIPGPMASFNTSLSVTFMVTSLSRPASMLPVVFRFTELTSSFSFISYTPPSSLT